MLLDSILSALLILPSSSLFSDFRHHSPVMCADHCSNSISMKYWLLCWLPLHLTLFSRLSIMSMTMEHYLNINGRLENSTNSQWKIISCCFLSHAYLGSSDVELIGSCCACRPLDPLVSGSFVRTGRTSLSASDD